jgi:hypothetical protein
VKQEEAIRVKALNDNKKREDDIRRKKAMDLERQKWLDEQEKGREEKEKIKKEARLKA